MRLIALKHNSCAAIAAALVIAAAAAAAKAEPAVGVTAVCPATGPGIVACSVVGVAMHEIVQIANGKEGFGPNGDLMKLLAAPVRIVHGNIKASERESGELAKVLRSTMGISVKDINEYGIWGGPNSFFREPFG
jgi:hypothetical protein